MRTNPAPVKQFALTAALLLAPLLPTAVLRGNTESGIATTPAEGLPSACLESDLKKLLESCIARNKSNPPPGNPGPFTRGYKEMIVLLGQCFGGGFTNLTCLGDNVVVGAAADPQKEARAGWTENPHTGSIDVALMLWSDTVINNILPNSNAPVKALLDAVRAANPDPLAMTPPPAFSPGGDSIVMGDPGLTRTNCSFHAVLFSGVSEVAGKEPGQVSKKEWAYELANNKALKDMRATLIRLNVTNDNIQSRRIGTYADLQQMITNAWAQMNDNEQFILLVTDHGSRHCGNTNVTPRLGGNGYSVSFMTESYLESASVENPTVALNTSFIGAPGEVRFNQHFIGMLPAHAGLASHEFVFNPNLIKPVGQTNIVDVVVPDSNVGVESVDLSTGPVLGDASMLGADPVAAVINVCNATGSNKTDFHAMYEGRLSTNVATRARRTLEDGTPVADWAVSNTTITYDPTNDVTTVSWEDMGSPITNGGYASFSVVESNRPLLSLLYTWSPASSNPTNDFAPVNLKSIRSVTSSNLELVFLSAPLLTRTQLVDFSVAFANNRIPASQFYFGDPAVTSLPGSPTQAVVLDPETFQAASVTLPSLPPDAPLPTAVVRSWERWANGVPPNNVSRITQIPMLPDSDTVCLTNCPGSGVFLTVNLAGGVFKWYKDGQLITGETGDTLTLLSLSNLSAGTYTGIATNSTEVKRKFFKLMIADRVPPTVNCPGDITVEATSASGAVVNYGGVSASDPCGVIDGSTFQCNPPPGSLFPVGVTEVTCSVADTFGNVGVCRFNVTVLPPGAALVLYPNRTYGVLRWADPSAQLQTGPEVVGPWTTMPAATSPYTISNLFNFDQWFARLIGP